MSLSHRAPFWCGTLRGWRAEKTSVRLSGLVSSRSSGRWRATQTYRRQAANARTTKTAKSAPARTLPVITRRQSCRRLQRGAAERSELGAAAGEACARDAVARHGEVEHRHSHRVEHDGPIAVEGRDPTVEDDVGQRLHVALLEPAVEMESLDVGALAADFGPVVDHDAAPHVLVDARREVAQRDVELQRAGLRRAVDVRSRGDRAGNEDVGVLVGLLPGRDDPDTRAHGVVQTGAIDAAEVEQAVFGDPRSELLFAELEMVAADRTPTDDSDAGAVEWPGAVEVAEHQAAHRRRTDHAQQRGVDDRDRLTGVGRVEDDDAVRPRQTALEVAGEARDPLDPGDLERAAEESGHGDDAVLFRPVAQVRFDRLRVVAGGEAAHRSFHRVDRSLPGLAQREQLALTQVEHAAAPRRRQARRPQPRAPSATRTIRGCRWCPRNAHPGPERASPRSGRGPGAGDRRRGARE